MSKDKISDYSATANSNTDIAGINIDEGCAPSGINNAIRTLMKQLKDFQQGTNSDSFNGPVNGTIGATTPASGAFTTLSSTGNTTLGDASADTVTVNGTATFNASPVISVTDNTNAALRITQLGTGNALLVEDAANPDSTPFVIDASGRTLIGYTSNLGITDALLQVSDTTDKQAILSRFSNNSSPSTLIFAKSLSGTLGTNTILTNGDSIGTVQFRGADGASYIQAASITAAVDGTPGTNDMPGRLIFSTTADGASSPTERARINSSGNLGLGVTPSAWSTLKGFDIGSTGSLSSHASGSTDSAFVSGNAYFNGTNWIYKATSTATQYKMYGGVHSWFNAASGTAGNAISFTQAMTLDSSGRLGIGTTSPNVSLHIENSSSVIKTFSSGNNAAYTVYQSNGNGKLLYVGQDNSTGASFGVGGYSSVIWNDGAYPIVFATNNAERARIDSSGNLLVGTTTYRGRITSEDTGLTTSASPMGVNVTGSAGSGSCWVLASVRLGTNVGGIQNTSTATQFVTSSDYRLKNSVAPMTGALTKVAALKPVTYKWNADDSEGEGFIAHELAEVCPQAVTGEKDAVDEDGAPIHQGIDTSFLVATLTAAIQEQQAMIASQSELITQLQTDVAALKG